MEEQVESYPHLKKIDALIGRIFKITQSWTFPLIVLGVWGYAIYSYGWFLGGGLGWIPALVAAFIFSELIKGILYLCAFGIAIWFVAINWNNAVQYLQENVSVLIVLAATFAIWGYRREIAKIPAAVWRKVLYGGFVLVVVGFVGSLLLTYPVWTVLGLGFIGSLTVVVVAWRNRDRTGEVARKQRAAVARSTGGPWSDDTHFRCPQCSEPTAFQQADGLLRCHTCGHTFDRNGPSGVRPKIPNAKNASA